MWTDSSAIRDGTMAGAPAACTTTPVWRRLRRCGALLAYMVRLWVRARFGAPQLDWFRRRNIVAGHARELLDILNVRVVVRGQPPPPDWPLLLVANHVSWVDTYALNAINGARFVAKSEVRQWPVIRTIAQQYGTFFIVRGHRRDAARTATAVARALRSGDPVGVFPEGTTSDGSTVRGFFPALFQAAIDADALVQPVGIGYRTPTGEPSPAAAFVDDMSLADSLHRLFATPQLVVELTFCAPLFARGRTRRELAQLAHESIAGALGISAADPPARQRIRRAA